MSDNVLIALLSAIPATLAAIGALLVSLSNNKKINTVQHQTNSLLEQRVKAEGSLKGAEGREEGRLLGKTEAAEDRAQESKNVEAQVVKTQTVEVQEIKPPDKKGKP